MLAGFSCASSRAAALSAHAVWSLAAAAPASAPPAANTIPPITRKKTRNETRRTVASITPETIRVGGYFNPGAETARAVAHRTATAPSGSLPRGTVPVRSAWRVLAPMQNRLEGRAAGQWVARRSTWLIGARPYLRSCGACGRLGGRRNKPGHGLLAAVALIRRS